MELLLRPRVKPIPPMLLPILPLGVASPPRLPTPARGFKSGSSLKRDFIPPP